MLRLILISHADVADFSVPIERDTVIDYKMRVNIMGSLVWNVHLTCLSYWRHNFGDSRY